MEPDPLYPSHAEREQRPFVLQPPEFPLDRGTAGGRGGHDSSRLAPGGANRAGVTFSIAVGSDYGTYRTENLSRAALRSGRLKLPLKGFRVIGREGRMDIDHLGKRQRRLEKRVSEDHGPALDRASGTVRVHEERHGQVPRFEVLIDHGINLGIEVVKRPEQLVPVLGLSAVSEDRD